jgi:hypothetical protein
MWALVKFLCLGKIAGQKQEFTVVAMFVSESKAI